MTDGEILENPSQVLWLHFSTHENNSFLVETRLMDTNYTSRHMKFPSFVRPQYLLLVPCESLSVSRDQRD